MSLAYLKGHHMSALAILFSLADLVLALEMKGLTNDQAVNLVSSSWEN